MLLIGDDESLLVEELGTRIHEALGGADRSLALDDFDADRPTIDERESVIRSAVDAAATQSLFSEFRVVVLRRIDAAVVESLQPLVDYLANPLESTRLILTSKGKPPKSIGDAIKRAGGTSVSTSIGDSSERAVWYRTQLEAAGLRLDPAAISALTERLGEDVGRFPGILDTLISTFGTSKKLTRDDVLPFVGEAGTVPVLRTRQRDRCRRHPRSARSSASHARCRRDAPATDRQTAAQPLRATLAPRGCRRVDSARSTRSVGDEAEE